MSPLESVLAKHPFFHDLEPRYLQLSSGCGANVRFEADEYLFREGEEADQFYVIRHGKVRLEIAAPPREPLIIDTIEAGEVLGWSWLFPPYRWHFDAIASELTRATALDGKCLRAKCEEDHDLGYELVKRFAHVVEARLQSTRIRLLDMYGPRA